LGKAVAAAFDIGIATVDRRRNRLVAEGLGAEGVWRMEDHLDLDAELYDRRELLACCEETLYHMACDTRQALPACPSQPWRYDDR
jgi:hypothetical protein